MSEQVALYARVSSERQAEQGTVESQLATLQEYAAKQQYRIDEDLVFIDNGVSGTTLIRPALDALRDKAVTGQIDKMLVLCPDRLARKHVHQLVLVEELTRLGIQIEFTNHTTSDSPEDQLLFQIQGVIAEFEREKIVERCRRGKDHKAKAGKVNVLSAAPYGYVYIPANESHDARYEIHPDESKVVRMVFKMLTMERKSIRTIAKELTEKGFPCRRGGTQWNPSTIGKMLRNPAYSGKAGFRKSYYVPRTRATKQAYDNSYYPRRHNSSQRMRPKEEWIYIPVPRLVGDDIFQKVQRQLEENKQFSPRNNKTNHYLLSGILRCKVCGFSMYGKPALGRDKTLTYYRCLGRNKHRYPSGSVCPARPVRVEVLDDIVWEQTTKLINQPEVVFNEYSSRTNKKSQQKIDIEALLAKKEKELRNQEYEKQRLLDLYQTGSLTLDEIQARLELLRGRIGKIQQEYSLLEKESKQQQHTLQLLEQFDVFKTKLGNNLNALSFDERNLVRGTSVPSKNCGSLE